MVYQCTKLLYRLFISGALRIWSFICEKYTTLKRYVIFDAVEFVDGANELLSLNCEREYENYPNRDKLKADCLV